MAPQYLVLPGENEVPVEGGDGVGAGAVVRGGGAAKVAHDLGGDVRVPHLSRRNTAEQQKVRKYVLARNKSERMKIVGGGKLTVFGRMYFIFSPGGAKFWYLLLHSPGTTFLFWTMEKN